MARNSVILPVVPAVEIAVRLGQLQTHQLLDLVDLSFGRWWIEPMLGQRQVGREPGIKPRKHRRDVLFKHRLRVASGAFGNISHFRHDPSVVPTRADGFTQQPAKREHTNSQAADQQVASCSIHVLSRCSNAGNCPR